jgi:hypothetical protein
MADLAWIVPFEQIASLGDRGVSRNYILPKSAFHSDPIDLIGSRLIIIARGVEDRCIAVLSPNKIEQFSEGYYNGDYLISVDILKSIRLSRDFNSAKAFHCDFAKSIPLGLSMVNANGVDQILEMAKQSMQFKFIQPKLKNMQASLGRLPNNRTALVSQAMKVVISQYTLGEVWGNGKPYKLLPFANFAWQWVLSQGSTMAEVDDFIGIDPLTLLTKPSDSKPKEADVVHSSYEPLLDLDFSEIDPSTVYARKFIVSNSTIDIEAALNRTEAAERMHQEMLRDIVTYLKQCGIAPMQSDSVDLLFDQGGTLKLLEIKSANEDNLFAQVAKGAFQIAYYSNALALSFREPIQKIENERLLAVISTVLKRLGISYLIYDPSKPWPNRVKGILD